MRITVDCKRFYNKIFLKEVMIILENENDNESATGGFTMLQNLRYTI